MQAKKANKAMQSTDKGQHALGVDGLMAVIENLGNPDYIVYQNSGENAGHYVAIISIDGGDTVAAVDLGNYRSGPDAVNGENGYYNVLITAFSADSNYINNTIFADENDVLYDKSSNKKNEVSEHVAAGDSRLDLASDSSSMDIIRSSSAESNPQNQGRASVEVGADPRQELRRAIEEFERHNNANDTEYDYRAAGERINELQRQVDALEAGTEKSLRLRCAPLRMTGEKRLGTTTAAPQTYESTARPGSYRRRSEYFSGSERRPTAEMLSPRGSRMRPARALTSSAVTAL